MKRPLAILILLAAFLVATTRQAEASIPTGTQVVLIFVAVGAIGAAIGVGVYYAVRQPPSITGCLVSGRAGLTLQNEADQKIFLLTGDAASLPPGHRVRVKGKKKNTTSGPSLFFVEKLRNDFGACPVTPAAP